MNRAVNGARALPPLPPSGLVFDLDGTLIDSVPDLHAAVVAMLAGLGRAPLDRATVQSFIGNGVARLVARALAATGGADAALEAEGLAAFRAAYDAAPADRTRPYPGVEALLARACAAGVPLAVCTNKPEAPARVILDRLGLAPRFAAVIGGDTLAVLKPDPRPLEAALAAIGAAPGRAVYVGDSETDEATAHAAGVAFALFTGGYRKKPVEAFAAACAFDRFDALALRLGLAP